jgi:hypothetical protein
MIGGKRGMALSSFVRATGVIVVKTEHMIVDVLDLDAESVNRRAREPGLTDE